MKRRGPIPISIIAIASLMSLTAFGQFTSSISGTIHDPDGSVISGATVIVKNTANSAEFKATSSGSGVYTVPSLGAGTYIVTASAPGFKQAVVQDVKLDAGVPATVNVKLEVGAASETVVVQGGGEIVQTQTANVSTTLDVKQISNLPLQSRNVMYFLTLLPGVNTTGGPRGSTFNGLPQSTINVTIDGLNTQDNFNKTGDGFFSYISPRLDAIEEVTVSTATPGAESAGQGAIQIKFNTRQGGNDFHGGVYEYHRNPSLNSNYWFNNRDTSYNVQLARPCGDPNSSSFSPTTMVPWTPDCRATRPKVLLNQFGFRVGGPFVFPKKLFGPLAVDGHDKAFFFFNYEEFRLATQVSRQRTVMSPDAQRGVFRYGSRSVDVLALAGRSNCAPSGSPSVPCTSTIDPTVEKLLADIRNSTAGAGGIQQLSDRNLQRFTFPNDSFSHQYYPTLRLDFNLSDKHHLETSAWYQNYFNTIDTLNNRDPQFPGFPNHGGQSSDRFSISTALRSTLTPTIVNEGRVGFNGGTVRFFPDVDVSDFNGPIANQAGFSLGISAFGNATQSLTNATNTTSPSRRNAPVWTFSDTLSWTRGAHSLNFGGSFTQANFWTWDKTLVPSITLGVNTNDPAAGMFNTTNFPGANSTQLNSAQNLYAVLTGRVTAINAASFLDEKTGQYSYLNELVQRGRQRELGVFAQDSWRARPSLTLTYGLRWELQLPFTPLNSSYSTSTLDDIWGASVPGALFTPGATRNRVTQFIPLKKGDRAYNTDYRDFAPSFGFAWSPSAKDGWLKSILGGGGQTVLRGGYSIAYNRMGLATFSGVFDGNAGASINANRSTTLGNLVTNVGNDRLPVLLRERDRLGPPSLPSAPAYPLTDFPYVAITGSVSVFDPKIRVPYTQSWSLGLQREISKDMAVEVRYVHTVNLQQWVTYNLNEVNIVENGFLEEFKRAQANLQANIAAGRGNNFRYFGPGTGTSPLPTYLAYFSGAPTNTNGVKVKPDPNLASSYSSSLFANSGFVNPLAANNPNPYAPASASTSGTATGLYADPQRRQNAIDAGLPANFFVANPGLLGGANYTGNGGYSKYDGLQVELRRRLSKGLEVNANYTFARSFVRSRPSFRTPGINTLGDTLEHAFKASWVYELPIGRGKALFGNTGAALDRFIGGWEFHGTTRIQSGNYLNFGNVRLVGMTPKELQKAAKLRFDDAAGIVYYLPDDIILNTQRAFSVSATSATGFGDDGPPTGRYIAPANSASCTQVVAGDCAPNTLYVNGPMFTRFDLSAVKRVKINERINFELRGEILNAFNNINFFGVTCASNSATCGQVTAAYTDPNNTQDPGGRLVQIVARFNF
jgi:hypothetical protein